MESELLILTYREHEPSRQKKTLNPTSFVLVPDRSCLRSGRGRVQWSIDSCWLLLLIPVPGGGECPPLVAGRPAPASYLPVAPVSPSHSQRLQPLPLPRSSPYQHTENPCTSHMPLKVAGAGGESGWAALLAGSMTIRISSYEKGDVSSIRNTSPEPPIP